VATDESRPQERDRAQKCVGPQRASPVLHPPSFSGTIAPLQTRHSRLFVRYSQDYSKSAVRHYESAAYLYKDKLHLEVAGYLYGVAAECAFKQMMSEAGLRPAPDLGRDDPFKCHFPELKKTFQRHANDRRARDLLEFTKTGFMQEWDTDMRYAPKKDVKPPLIERWKNVLSEPTTRAHVAKPFPELAAIDVVIGFNGSSRVEPVAPTEDMIRETVAHAGCG
jgi:hypothetical protein